MGMMLRRHYDEEIDNKSKIGYGKIAQLNKNQHKDYDEPEYKSEIVPNRRGRKPKSDN